MGQRWPNWAQRVGRRPGLPPYQGHLLLQLQVGGPTGVGLLLSRYLRTVPQSGLPSCARLPSPGGLSSPHPSCLLEHRPPSRCKAVINRVAREGVESVTGPLERPQYHFSPAFAQCHPARPCPWHTHKAGPSWRSWAAPSLHAPTTSTDISQSTSALLGNVEGHTGCALTRLSFFRVCLIHLGALSPGPGRCSIMFPQVHQQEPGREAGNGGPEGRGPAVGAEIGSARLGRRRECMWPSGLWSSDLPVH